MANGKDLEISYVNPKELNFRDNVRFRADSNLAELMESIKQHGIQSPIGVRKEDNTIIWGHRRVAGAIKLNLKEVPVIFKVGLSDKEVNILNLMENMQRKDVSSIEIGRQCDIMLKNVSFKMSMSELATALGVPVNRIKTCWDSFRHLPAEFRDKVVHITSSRERKFGELPENIVFAILNFSRIYKILKENDLHLFLKVAGEEKLTIAEISIIGRLYSSGMNFRNALKEARSYTMMRIDIAVLKTELHSILKKEKVKYKGELVINALKEKYPNLVF